MARKSHRRCVALALLAACLCCYSPSSLGFASDDAKDQLEKAVKVWKQPHAIRIAGSKFAVDTISQGAPQWQVRATEANGSTALFAAREDGGSVVYGVNYDSAKSGLKPPYGSRVALAATGDEEGSDFDWTVQVERSSSAPQRIAFSGNSEDMVYDATVAAEKPLGGGVTGLAAVDMKRRAGDEGFLPTWIKPSFGAKYASGNTEYRAAVFPDFQQENTTTVDWEAVMKGRLEGWSSKQGGKILTTDPQYSLRLSKDGLQGLVKAPAKLGTAFGLAGTINTEGQYDVAGYGEWTGERKVVDGVKVDSSIKASASRGSVDVQPLGTGVTLDLGTLAPKFAAKGSTLALQSRYKFGASRPAVAAAMALSPAKVPEVDVVGLASYDSSGDLTSSVKVTASKLRGVDAKYEMRSSNSKFRQAIAMASPRVDFGDGSYLRLTGKAYKGEEFGEKPRVQLGVQYEGKVDILGRSLDLGGESAGFDSGRSLLDEMGRPWTSPELKKATNTAKVVRARIASEYGEGKRWISK
ncbi:unnamed protein product [Symbiodinium sp. CCMP2592]|nr:unnamed protein product [Symbiodinium sp. CCMP2592]